MEAHGEDTGNATSASPTNGSYMEHKALDGVGALATTSKELGHLVDQSAGEPLHHWVGVRWKLNPERRF